MRGKHCRTTVLVALGVTPGIALAAPGLQNMADSLDEMMKILPMVMGPLVMFAAMVFLYSSGSSEQSEEQEASAEIPASVPSSVERLQEAASRPDQVAKTTTDPFVPTLPDQPGRVGRKLHLD